MGMGYTIKEEECCCDEFIKQYIIHKGVMPSSILAYNLSLKLKKEIGTIKMKISNIVYIINRLKIQHTCDAAELSHFSEQNFKILCQLLLKKYHIPLDKELVKKLIAEKLEK